MIRYSLFKNLRKSPKDKEEEENEKEVTSLQPIKFSEQSFLLKRGYLLSDEKLGEGSYSKVRRAYSKYHNSEVAVKIINRHIAPKDFLDRFLPRELEIIGQLNHTNICKFFEVFDTGSKVYVFMEYASEGDLLDYIQRYKFVEESLARGMFVQIVQAVEHLHFHNILHRDLKCENVLLGHNLKPLLTDFGFAKYTPEITDLNKTYCGSSAYAPIEILKGTPYDGRSADAWSIGCILHIMTTGTMPFDDGNKAEQIKQMKKGPPLKKSRQKISEVLQLLIVDILDINAKTRPTLTEILQNEWCFVQPVDHDVGVSMQ